MCVVYESSNGWINVKLIELFYQDFVPKSLYLISMDLPLKLDNWALPSVWGETWSWHHLSPHTNPTGWGWPRALRRRGRRRRHRRPRRRTCWGSPPPLDGLGQLWPQGGRRCGRRCGRGDVTAVVARQEEQQQHWEFLVVGWVGWIYMWQCSLTSNSVELSWVVGWVWVWTIYMNFIEDKS